MAGLNKERNHTSYSGRYSIRWEKPYTAPDGLIEELESIMAQGGFASTFEFQPSVHTRLDQDGVFL